MTNTCSRLVWDYSHGEVVCMDNGEIVDRIYDYSPVYERTDTNKHKYPKHRRRKNSSANHIPIGQLKSPKPPRDIKEMNTNILEEARKLLEEIQHEDPRILEKVLTKLGPEAYLIKYLLAKKTYVSPNQHK